MLCITTGWIYFLLFCLVEKLESLKLWLSQTDVMTLCKIYTTLLRIAGFPSGSVVESACNCERRGFSPWVGKISWRGKWQPTSMFLPGNSHGQRSLVGYSPWGGKSQTRLSDWTWAQGLLQDYKSSSADFWSLWSTFHTNEGMKGNHHQPRCVLSHTCCSGLRWQRSDYVNYSLLLHISLENTFCPS